MNRIINLHYANTETTYKLPRIHYAVQVHRKINPSEGDHSTNPQNLQTKNYKIMNLRFQFFNTETKEWFKPKYKPLSDLLLTGNGDIYHVQEEANGPQQIDTTLNIVNPLYKVAQYVGVRDENQNKYLTGSIVQTPDGKVGVLNYAPNGLYLQIGDDIDPISELMLRASKIIGHSFEKKKD